MIYGYMPLDTAVIELFLCISFEILFPVRTLVSTSQLGYASRETKSTIIAMQISTHTDVQVYTPHTHTHTVLTGLCCVYMSVYVCHSPQR